VVVLNLEEEMKAIYVIIGAILSWSLVGVAQTEKVYDLKLHYLNLNRAGVNKPKSIGINGTSPGPTLRFQLGDMAVIKVTNTLSEDTSIHWHGLLVPWNMDGPSFTNNFVLKPGKSQTFRFQIKQTGTYWYHSHTMFQEQVGMNGAIVIEDDHHRFHGDQDFVMVLSDWTNEDPVQVLKNLKTDGEYYNIKKKFFPSVWDAMQRAQIWDFIKNEWTKMGQMDLSDIGYDAFLVNGQRVQKFSEAKPGELVRVRLINAGASSYFYVNLGNMRPFTVITKDGQEVEPVEVNEVLMGMGETYDILFEMPEADHPMGIELRATSMDTTGWASAILGEGEHVERPPTKVRPSPYKMGHEGHNDGGGSQPPPPGDGGGHGGGGHGDHRPIAPNPMMVPDHGDHDDPNPPTDPNAPVGIANRLDYSMLKAPQVTAFDPKLKRHEIMAKLTGNMDRYIWYMNDKMFSDDKYLMIKENEVVRVTIDNQSMMRHPMHLHGHFFRVLNGQGDNSPNFHTVDVAPGQKLVVEFWANEPGIWFFHCHNLYHMEMGMARLFKYEGFELPKDMKEEEVLHHHSAGSKMDDKTFVPSAQAEVYTNMSRLSARLNGGNWDINMEVEVEKYKTDHLSAELLFQYYLKPFLSVIGGTEYEDKQIHAILGFAYRLPLRIDMKSYVRSDGKVVLKFKKIIPIVERLSLELSPEASYGGGDGFGYQLENKLTYAITPKFKIGGVHKKSDELGHTLGVGISLTFN
jgi:FtsP/CotA-like multicopper oxidase with cupredoxin domain